jgi:hypothetical protein
MRPVKIRMRAEALVLFLIASALVTANAAEAQSPSFAGRWVLAPDSPGVTQRGGRPAPGNQGTGWGADLTVTQDASTLTIEYARFARSDMQPPTKLVYQLDGSESRNAVNVGRGPQEQLSRAAWDGPRLIITTRHRFSSSPSGVTPGSQAKTSGQEMTSDTKHVLWLESPASLVIETTRSGVMGGPASTARSVYKKP